MCVSKKRALKVELDANNCCVLSPWFVSCARSGVYCGQQDGWWLFCGGPNGRMNCDVFLVSGRNASR